MTLRSVLVLAAALAVGFALAGPAQAATFTVTTTANMGAGSLRQAITDANGAAGTDDIDFSIPGAGPHTIMPLSALPTIDQAVDIDGTTEPGTTSTQLQIELDGASLLVGDGLVVNTAGATIRGLAIDNFDGDGIEVNSSSTGATIAGNFIGVGANGTSLAEGNEGNGIRIEGNTNTVGGSVADRNVIGGNGTVLSGTNGIQVTGNTNVIRGNYVGVDRTGLTASANETNGIQLNGNNNIVGGSIADDRNVISGNVSAGIGIGGADGSEIYGNYLGVGSDGATAVGTQDDGVAAFNITNTVIGGVVGIDRNVISGNSASGVYIDGSGNSANAINGNLIGRNAANAAAVPNGIGVNLGNADGTDIFGNTIAHSTGKGLKIVAGTGNELGGNEIFSNGTLGISLQNTDDDPIPNDAGDADTGANNQQNYPVIDRVVARPNGYTTIEGTLNSTATEEFRIEAFGQSACDASGNGEGEEFLGDETVNTNGSGAVSFVVEVLSGVGEGDEITTTATRTAGTGETSEFSACKTAESALIVNSSDPSDSDGGCDLVCTFDDALGNAFDGAPSRIEFDIPGGAQVLDFAGGTVFEDTVIDGTTQPGGITLDGTNALPGADGLQLAGGDTVLGLTIRDFPDNGIEASGASNVIGGPGAGQGNVITGNGADGVAVTATATGNLIRGNRISGNGELGIDLDHVADDGVTANDPGDTDGGANGRQNFPVITTATATAGTDTVSGTLNSVANQPYRIEVFVNGSCDASGNGEGAEPFGISLNFNTNASGNATWQVTGSGIDPGDIITAVATRNSTGATSEFSTCKTATVPPPPPPPATADLDLTLTADDDTPEPGEPFNYTATVLNRGPATAFSPKVQVTLAPSVRFVVTKPAACAASGQVVTCGYPTLANGARAARTIRVMPTLPGPLAASATASSNTPDPSPASSSKSVTATLPAPAPAKQVNVKEVKGTVKIKQPGEGAFRVLDGADRIRIGALVDTTKGRVRLTTSAGGKKTQTAEFYEGLFKVTQTKGKKPITELRLAGKLTGCKGKASIAAKRRGRRLWGKGKGRFRTRGKRSSALVRGTTWLVEDRCNGTTLTDVRAGRVEVRDFRKKRTKIVRAGGRYVAR